MRSPLRRTETYQQCCSGCYQRTGRGRKEMKVTACDKRDRQAGRSCAHAAVPVHGTSHPHLQSSGVRWWHAHPQGQGRGRPQRSQYRDPSGLVREQCCAGQKRPQPQRLDRHCGLAAHGAHGSRWARACLSASSSCERCGHQSEGQGPSDAGDRDSGPRKTRPHLAFSASLAHNRWAVKDLINLL